MKPLKYSVFKHLLDKIFNNRFLLLFLIITFIGLILRVYFILKFDIYTDEVFYTSVARMSSFVSLIQTTGWLKDHGQLYLIFLKIVQNITTDIIFLRHYNIFLYLILSFSLFKFFNKFQKGLILLFPVVLFSFLPYFIYLNCYVSPYNFVMFFSILAFIFLSDYILCYPTKINKYRDIILYILFSTLAFYSDYSVIYFYLSLVPVALLTFKWNKKLAKEIVQIGFVNFILIFPGILLLINNFKHIHSINSVINIYISIDTFFRKFTNLIIFNLSPNFSILIFIIFIISIVYILLNSKNKFLKYLSFVSIFGFLINIVFLYIFNKYYFFILMEQTFWYFYFLLILGLSTILFYLHNFKKTFIIVFIMIILFMGIKFLQSYKSNPISTKNINYKEFVNNLFLNKRVPDNSLIVLKDTANNYRYIPLNDYYFEGLNNKEEDNIIGVRNYFENMDIKILNDLRQFNNLYINDKQQVIFIIFDCDEGRYLELKNLINIYEKKEQIKAIYTFYRLSCVGSYRNFYLSK